MSRKRKIPKHLALYDGLEESGLSLERIDNLDLDEGRHLIHGLHEDTRIELGKITQYSTIHEAIQEVVLKQSRYLLCDWKNVKGRFLGSLCKVFWDGENNWYYGRIIGYSAAQDCHFVYYLEDNTGEWIRLEDECILVAKDTVSTKMTKQSSAWPGLTFWASGKAMLIIETMNGYVPNCEFVEFFSDQPIREYSFVKLQFISVDVGQDMWPKKRTKKLEASLACSQQERDTRTKLLEEIKQSMLKIPHLFRSTSGKDIIGVRLQVLPAVCRGTESGATEPTTTSIRIAKFFPRSRLHLLVVEEDSYEVARRPSAQSTRSTSAFLPGTFPLWWSFADNGHNFPWAEVTGLELGSPGEGEKAKQASQQMGQISEPLEAGWWTCRACSRLSEMSCDGESSISCSKCNTRYHESCIPASLRQPNCTLADTSAFSKKKRKQSNVLALSAGDPVNEWVCWECVRCDSCGKSSFESAIGEHFLADLVARAPDDVKQLCEDCLTRYRSQKDHCPICFRLNHELSQLEPPLSALSPSEPVDSTLPVHSIGVEGAATAGNLIAEDTVVKPSRWKRRRSSSDMTQKVVSLSGGYEGMSLGGIDCGIAHPDAAVLENDNPLSKQVQCNECEKWVHCLCEGIDDSQYEAVGSGTHPVWGDEYYCPPCRLTGMEKVLVELKKQDRSRLFAEPVSSAVAKHYFEIIRNPMDLQTISSKVRNGAYKSLQAMRSDAELMCLNALTFNKVGDEYWVDARQYFLDMTQIFGSSVRTTHTSAYGHEAMELLAKKESQKKFEKNPVEIKSSLSKSAGRPKVGQKPKSIATDSGSGAPQEPKMKKGRLARQPVIPDDLARQESVQDSEKRNTEVTETNETNANASGPLTTRPEPESLLVDLSVLIPEETKSVSSSVPSNGAAVEVVLPQKRRPGRRRKEDKLRDEARANGGEDPNSTLPLDDHKRVVDMTAVGASEKLPQDPAHSDEEEDAAVAKPGRPPLGANKAFYQRLKVKGDRVDIECVVLVDAATAASWASFETCLVCGSSGSSSHLLICKSCGEAVHSFCVSQYYHQDESSPCVEPTLISMTEESRRNWNCPCCATCRVCGQTVERKQKYRSNSLASDCYLDRVDWREMIRCQQCASSHHLDCLFPTIPRQATDNKVLVESFYCSDCVQCRRCGSGRDDDHQNEVLMWGPESSLCIRCSGQATTLLIRNESSSIVKGDSFDLDDVKPIKRCSGCAGIIEESALTDEEYPSGVAFFDDRNLHCQACLRSLRESRTLTHPGSGAEAWNVLEAVAQIQRERITRKRFGETLLADTERSHQRKNWEMWRPFYSTIIHWAAILLKEEKSKMVTNTEINTSQCEGWIIKRGRRFSRFISRWFMNSPRREGEFFWENMDVEALVRLAALAAAFIIVNMLNSGSKICPKEAMDRLNVQVEVRNSCDPSYVRFSSSMSPSKEEEIKLLLKFMLSPPTLTSSRIGLPPSAQSDIGDSVVSMALGRGEGKLSDKSSLLFRTMTKPPHRPLNISQDEVSHKHNDMDNYLTNSNTGISFGNHGQKSGSEVTREREEDVIIDAVFQDFSPLPSKSMESSYRRKALKHYLGDKILRTSQLNSSNIRPSRFSDEFSSDGGDLRVCVLCKGVEPDSLDFEQKSIGDKVSAQLGRLLPVPWTSAFVHANCARWSGGVIERGHYLCGVHLAVSKARSKHCIACGKPGASIACNFHGRRFFHLPCAIASKCLFSQFRPGDQSLDSTHDVITAVSLILSGESWGGRSKNLSTIGWIPQEPLRRLHVLDETAEKNAHAESLLAGASLVGSKDETRKVIARKITDFVVDSISQWHDEYIRFSSKATGREYTQDTHIRCGAVTIHSIGAHALRTSEFITVHHQRGLLFPILYRSSRLFGSRSRESGRTLYMFEILEWDPSANGHVFGDNTMQSLNEVDGKLVVLPLFRVMSLAQPGVVFSSLSIIDCYRAILANDLTGSPRTSTPHLLKEDSPSELRTASRFFGLALPVLHHAIELLIQEGIARLSVPLDYRPLYGSDGKMRRSRNVLRTTLFGEGSGNGSIRANGFNPTDQLSEAALGKARDESGPKRSFKRSKRFSQDESASDKPVDDEAYMEVLRDRYFHLEANARMNHPPVVCPESIPAIPWKIRVSRSDIHDWGLFACMDIPKDSMIIEYVGEKIRQTVADIREQKYELEGVGSCYFFRLDKNYIIDATKSGGMARFLNHSCDANAYAQVISLGKGHHRFGSKSRDDIYSEETSDQADSKVEEVRGRATIDDSRDSATEGAVDDPWGIKDHYQDEEEEEKHIVLFAARDIKKGQEITYDYKFPLEDVKLTCNCGADNCKGIMN